MHTLSAYIDGIGLLGPGFKDWPGSRAILTGQAAYQYQPAVLPPAASLAPAERRRCGPIVKLSLAVGFEAAAAAGLDCAGLPTVFSASSGDGENCHQICQMLASDDRQISPTRFHNSVHNAASGYWTIAAQSMAPSSVLCAYDASFGAGLLEALSQVVVDHTSALLIACDTTYPEPLHQVRPIPDEFGIGLVFAPQRSANSLARIRVALTSASAAQMTDIALENLRTAIPAARGLPLLHALANRASTALVLDYLDTTRLAVEIESWA
ncbi:MAG: beta-ketoacyl synthase chain length factor [Glaciimonas sp.]|nr:beta-ketoacyl synthase chain length factor [Glaciimonas sp.]